jgi:plasmid stabilization system protein ParE
MEYRVELTDRASSDLRLLFLSIRAWESDAAARWFNGIERAIESLRERPGRCGVAPGNRRGQVIRQLLYGRKPNVYRILFRVLAKDRVVAVMHIRHGARLPDART